MVNEVGETAPDPAAINAAKYAIEVTEKNRKPAHPLANKVAVIVIALIILIGTFGAVIGTLNTVQLRNQNDTLKQEQQCQTVLLDTITREQKARAAIAADDREAQADYAESNALATSRQERLQALEVLKKQLAINEKRRSQFPVPTFDKTACKVVSEEAKKLGLTPSAPSSNNSPVKSSKVSGSKTTVANVPGTSPSANAPRRSASATAPANVPANGPTTVTRTAQRTVSVQKPGTTRTVVRPAPKPTSQPPASSRPRLLPLPGCSLTVLGLPIC